MIGWIVSSSLLILVLIGLRFLLRGRIKPKLQYALWALVLVRLLLPIQFGSTPISIENTVEKAPLVQEMAIADQVTHFTYHADGSATGYYTFEPILDHDPQSGLYNEPVPEIFTHEQANRITHLRTVKEYLMEIWIGGMILMGAAFLVSNLVFAGRLRKSRKLLEKGKLPVYVTEATETPCLFGVFRPAIYLTPAAVEEEHHREYAVTHEMTHYHHGDALWSVLRCLCLVVHWYNPLVWWAAVLSRTDGEVACDEATIATLGEAKRAEYGRVLIDLTCRKTTDLLRTATTMTGSAKGLKERIKRIAKKPKMAVYTLIAVVLVAAIAVGCTFTGGGDTKEPTDPTEITEPTGSTDPSNNTDPSQPTEPVMEEKLPETIIGTPLTKHELEQFTAMFTIIPEGSNWYNILLACEFTSPEDVNPKRLFQNGFRPLVELTDADEEFLLTLPWYIPNGGDVYKLPAARMETVVNTYLGVSLKDLNRTYLEEMNYFADGDCYFTGGGGAIGAMNFEIIDGKREDDGTVWLMSRSTDELKILCLKPQPGNDTVPYRVYSCMKLRLDTIQDNTPAASAEEYGKVKTGYVPFIYTGRPLMTATARIDTAGLEVGKLYICNPNTGKMHLVSNEKVACFDVTSQHLYYVIEGDNQVIRCDYEYTPVGENKTVVYTGAGTVTSVDHFGAYANELLLLVEDQNKVVTYRPGTGERNELFTAHVVYDAHYDNNAKRFDKNKSGHVVFWRGLPKEDSENESWLYYISSGEETYMKKPVDATAGYSGNIGRFGTGVFDGSELNFYTPMPEDLSGFKKGLLYSYDTLSGIYYQLSDSPVSRYCTTLIHNYLFFTDGSRIFCCDYMGGDMQVVYTSSNKITYADYKDGDELVIVEDESKVYLYNFVTGVSELLMEQPYIMDAHYYPDSSKLDGREKGRAILWHGKTSSDTQVKKYVYYIELDELYNPPWQ